MTSSTSQPSTEVTEQLGALLEIFVSGEQKSVEHARRMEGLIATAFPADHALQDLADMLAQYQPGGGDYLFSWEEMLPVATRWLERIRTP